MKDPPLHIIRGAMKDPPLHMQKHREPRIDPLRTTPNCWPPLQRSRSAPGTWQVFPFNYIQENRPRKKILSLAPWNPGGYPGKCLYNITVASSCYRDGAVPRHQDRWPPATKSEYAKFPTTAINHYRPLQPEGVVATCLSLKHSVKISTR